MLSFIPRAAETVLREYISSILVAILREFFGEINSTPLFSRMVSLMKLKAADLVA